MSEWLTAAGYSLSRVRFNADAPTKRHSFTVLGGDAALKIGNARRTLTAVDAHGSAVAMYISADKSPKMVRQEVQLKRMLRIINERAPKSWKLHRSKGCISLGALAVVGLFVGDSPESASRVQWSGAALSGGIRVVLQRHVVAHLDSAAGSPL
ncbi:unnamed protein product, partial [Prorocentrum cordatum]